MKALLSSNRGGSQGNQTPQSVPEYSFYNRSATGLDEAGWDARGKPMLIPKLYFTDREIGNQVYSPTLSDGLFIQNQSIIPVKWAVWKLLAINDEQYPTEEQYPLYCFSRKPYLYGELTGGDTASATFVNEHIRVFVDVDGNSQTIVQSNQEVKATNGGNTADLPGGSGYIRVNMLSRGTQSVQPALQTVVLDYPLDVNQIVVEKAGDLNQTAVSLTLTQAGLQLPLKMSRIGASEKYLVVKLQDEYLFAIYRADDPNKEIITGCFYKFNLSQFINIVSGPSSSTVQVLVVDKSSATPYFV